MPIPKSAVPREVSAELERVVERWRQLPLDRALPRVPDVQAIVAELAGEAVPDLGPAVLMDQLTVVVHDVCRDAVQPRAGRAGEGFAGQLTERLAGLRRSL